MKITKKKLLSLIENLLFEENNKYTEIIEDIKQSRGLVVGLKKRIRISRVESIIQNFLKNVLQRTKKLF